jgi:hypothetical protein
MERIDMDDKTTEALADRLGIKPQSLRARVCRTGSYFGLRPLKLPNGRLLWPADSVERLKHAANEPEVSV